MPKSSARYNLLRETLRGKLYELLALQRVRITLKLPATSAGKLYELRWWCLPGAPPRRSTGLAETPAARQRVRESFWQASTHACVHAGARGS
eukprot:2588996-Pyramimonas_sp.AAC.1